MHTFTKPTRPTTLAQRAPQPPDVSSHDDIDWRTVSVAEAIDADREHYQAMRGKLALLRARQSGKSSWSKLLQVCGIRKVTP